MVPGATSGSTSHAFPIEEPHGKAPVLFVVPAASPDPSYLGTAILRGILEQSGIPCSARYFWEVGLNEGWQSFEDKLVALILANEPRIVSFYTRCDTYHIVVAVAARIKRERSQIITVFGGPHASLCARETLVALPWVDYVCCGEGETTVAPFFASLLKDSPDTSVAGLAYRAEDGVVCNPTPALLEDGYRMGRDFYGIDAEFVEASSEPITVDVGRGCPFSCNFCSTKTFWQRAFRLRDLDDILDEVAYDIERYGSRSFSFNHDLFTVNRNAVLDFCDRIDARGLDISWDCSSRVDTLDEELLARMKKSGLRAVYVGVETGSPRMQKLTNKRLDLDRVLPLAHLLNKLGLSCTFSFIYGLPEETEDDLSCTLALMERLRDLGYSRVQLHKFSMLNGTAYFERYKDTLEWIGDAPEEVQPLGVRENKELIQANPELFPSFFGLTDALSRRYPHVLGFFRCYKRAPHSMRYALEWLGGDALDGYRSFVEVCGDLLDVSIAEEVENRMSFTTREWIPRNFAMLDRFFENLQERGMPACIAETYRFERLMLMMLFDATLPDSTDAYGFSWDVAVARGPLAELGASTARIRLYRDGAFVRTQCCRD